MNKACLSHFQDLADKYAKLQCQEWEALISIFKEQNHKKGEDIISANFDASKIFFICRGLVRYYYLSKDGKEWNKAFMSENTLCSSFTKDFLGDSSPYAVQAIENTTILITDYSEFEDLFEPHRSIERLGRKFVEEVLKSKMKRERSFLNSDATNRYVDFLNADPDLCKRIPQYHIASYLGIEETSFSRLLRKLS